MRSLSQFFHATYSDVMKEASVWEHDTKMSCKYIPIGNDSPISIFVSHRSNHMPLPNRRIRMQPMRLGANMKIRLAK